MARQRRALIVTLGRARGALTAARALAARGWFVGVGTPDGGGMVGTSRACSRRHVVPRPRGDAADFVAAVRRAVEEEGYDVVFGGGDDWMAALARYRDEVPAAVAHPPADVVTLALDKVELTRRARKAGLAAPATESASEEVLSRWRGPVVVKCRAHWEPGQTQRLRIEARRFSNTGAARERVEEIRRAGLQAVLQQPVDGQLNALVGLFHGGRLHGRVRQVTSRLWPTPSGVSTRARTVPVEEDLVTRAEALLDDLGWSGLVELQLITGDRGEPHLIDLNGRFYGSMALAEAARPGLTDAWGRQVLGEDVEPLPDARVGVRFAWEAGDLRRAGVERRGGLVRDVGSTLHWLAGARTSLWDRRDTGPVRHLAASRLHLSGRGSRPGP